jgi:site-specific recombinase XerD
MYRKTWAKMREDCKLPDTMQLYSLRDTGIISLFDNGADANTVKGAADHHDLNITSIYCDHVDEGLVEKVRKHSAKF